MKNSKFIYIILIIPYIFIFVFMFIYIINKNKHDSNYIKKAYESVVELKSETYDAVVSYGSAVIINDDGILITNAHLIVYKKSGVFVNYDSYEIRFSYEEDYREVSLIKYDLSKDIAVLKLNNLIETGSKKILIGKSSKLSAGDKVYALGNGLNHGIGLTEGIVSIPKINIQYNENTRNVIQCDLIINEGNSGGALLDKKGKLIGITSFRIKDEYGNIIYGLCYSIPIEEIIDYMNTII